MYTHYKKSTYNEFSYNQEKWTLLILTVVHLNYLSVISTRNKRAAFVDCFVLKLKHFPHSLKSVDKIFPNFTKGAIWRRLKRNYVLSLNNGSSALTLHSNFSNARKRDEKQAENLSHSIIILTQKYLGCFLFSKPVEKN